MNENIFDKRRLKTFSNCKDLVKSMIGTRDGIIVYNEKFRLDLETTCYKASMYDELQQENQSLKDRMKMINELLKQSTPTYASCVKLLDEIELFAKGDK